MDNIRIIDYIYGEMNEEEIRVFEAEMEQNPSLRKEVISLQSFREELSSEVDNSEKTSIASSITSSNKGISLRKTWYWIGVAASVLLLLSAGKWSNFRISTNAGGVSIGFGPVENLYDTQNPSEDDSLNLNSVIQLLSVMHARIDSQQKVLIDLAEAQSDISGKLDDAELESDLSEQQMNESWKNFGKQHQEYTNEMVAELLEYMEIRRQEDLTTINEGINNLVILLYNHQDAEPGLVYQQAEK